MTDEAVSGAEPGQAARAELEAAIREHVSADCDDDPCSPCEQITNDVMALADTYAQALAAREPRTADGDRAIDWALASLAADRNQLRIALERIARTEGTAVDTAALWKIARRALEAQPEPPLPLCACAHTSARHVAEGCMEEDCGCTLPFRSVDPEPRPAPELAEGYEPFVASSGEREIADIAVPAPELADDDGAELTGHVSIRFPADMAAAAKHLAAAEGMTVSAWIRREVEREAARRERPAPELAAAKPDLGTAWRLLDEARAENERLRQWLTGIMRGDDAEIDAARARAHEWLREEGL